MSTRNTERVLRGEVIVDASVDGVWDAWTTPEGVKSFFAPDCRIDPQPGGLYEIYFDLEAQPGSRGSEGMRVMAVQPKQLLSFTWNSPPELPEVRKQQTQVVVRLSEEGERRTRVTITQSGWGEGEQWDKSYTYFERAWKQVVLPRLKYRFAVGPVDWNNRPMTGPGAVLEKLDAIRAETLKRLDGLTRAQLNWRPDAPASGEEAWSLGEVFMHLAIDEHYLREQIARPLLEGVKPPDGVLFLPPPPPHGMSKDVIRFWFERARAMTRRMIEAWPADANLELKHVGGLEAMNGVEWLEGYGSHEAFHHRQIDALIAQLAEERVSL